jgi:hypothetical protein
LDLNSAKLEFGCYVVEGPLDYFSQQHDLLKSTVITGLWNLFIIICLHAKMFSTRESVKKRDYGVSRTNLGAQARAKRGVPHVPKRIIADIADDAKITKKFRYRFVLRITATSNN